MSEEEEDAYGCQNIADVSLELKGKVRESAKMPRIHN